MRLKETLPAAERRPASEVEVRPTLGVLDGVRGLSILMVLLHHVCLLPAPAHQVDSLIERATRPLWTGVDLLFLLSGFLITKSLLETVGRPSVGRFYLRRSLRILPLYTVSLLLFLVLFPAIPWEGFESYRGIGGPGARSFWLGFMNYHYSDEAAPGNLGHFWSLCVEIHFYLVWPLLLLPFRKALLPLCGIGILLVAVCRLLGFKTGYWTPDLGYHASHLRFDALLWGALVYGVDRRYKDAPALHRWLPPLLIFFGIVASLFLIVGRTRSSQLGNVLGFPAIDITFGIFLLLVLQRAKALFHGLLSMSFFRLCGRLSYALYVFHFPVLLLCKEWLFDGAFPVWRGMVWPAALLTGAVGIPLTFLVAWLSWHLLEKPCLSLKRHIA